MKLNSSLQMRLLSKLQVIGRQTHIQNY